MEYPKARRGEADRQATRRVVVNNTSYNRSYIEWERGRGCDHSDCVIRNGRQSVVAWWRFQIAATLKFITHAQGSLSSSSVEQVRIIILGRIEFVIRTLSRANRRRHLKIPAENWSDCIPEEIVISRETLHDWLLLSWIEELLYSPTSYNSYNRTCAIEWEWEECRNSTRRNISFSGWHGLSRGEIKRSV